MKVDLRCKDCGCGPEEHPEPSDGSRYLGICTCEDCSEYVSPLSELELAIALAAVDREAGELRDFRRLVEYAERKFPTMWFGGFSKLRESLRDRMNEEREKQEADRC